MASKSENRHRNIHDYLYKNFPDFWAFMYKHKTHNNKPCRLDRWQYMRDIYLDKSDYIVVKKSTQCGVSEWLIVKTIMNTRRGISVFYVLPTDDLKNRFVHNRFDRSVEFTPYYQSLMKQEEGQKAASVSLKHIGSGSVAFVGSNSTAPFTEYPADHLYIDELDECDQSNIEMGVERLSASTERRQVRVANPTITNYGIDAEWKKSDQKEWYVPCSSCGEEIHPDFFKHVVRQVEDDTYIVIDPEFTGSNEIRTICDRCGKPFDRFVKGRWIAQNVAGKGSGYHVSKMFSGTVSMNELVDRFNEGLANDTILQRFYNADLGLAFVSKGAKVDTSMLDECIADYNMPDHLNTGVCIMGVDVGKLLHVRINEILSNGTLRAVYIGTVHDDNDIADLYRRYRVRVGVIDAGPEHRLSQKLCTRFKGMFMCYYGGDRVEKVDPKTKTVTVPRTPALDAVKEMIVLKNIILPRNVASIPDYYAQMTCSTRIYEEDRDRYIWDEGSAADHYFHAECYCLLAKRIIVNAVSQGPSQSVKTA